MFAKLVIKLTSFALKRADLSLKDKELLLEEVTGAVGALPFDRTLDLIRQALQDEKMDLEKRYLLTGTILEKLEALPLRDIIKRNEGGKLLVNGRSLDYDVSRKLRNDAQLVLDSKVFEFVYEQVTHEAIKLGTLSGKSLDELYFYRAGIWFSKKLIEFLKDLADYNPPADE
jgi:hypothetical protein